MKVTAASKSARLPRSRSPRGRGTVFEKFAAEFGPATDNEPSGEDRVGAVELLIKLRRGKK